MAQKDLPASAARRQHNLRFDIRLRQRRPIRLAKAHAREIPQGPFAFRIRATGVKPCRRTHFPPPGFPTAPAIALEVMRDGSQSISPAIPDIALAIAIEIHRQSFKIARHELRLAHRPGPGALHAIRAGVAVVQNAQSRHQFIAEIGRAAPFPGQGGERFNHTKTASIATVIRLNAPNRDDHGRCDMIARFNPAQQIGVFRHQAPPILNARWRQHDAVAVIFPLHAAFRLAPVQFNHALIGADARKRLVQRGLRNPGAAGIGAHPIQEAFKALAGNRLIGRRAIGRGGLMGGIRLWAAGRDQGRDSTK